jgi:hypothetical protein
MNGYSPIGDINSGDQSFGARRPYLVDGDYNLEVERCVERGRGAEKSFVIEATVLESNAPERPPGTQVAIFIDMTNTDTRGKHLCAFLASCHGIDPMTLPKNSTATPWDGQPWAGYVVYAYSEQNPYAKRRIHVNAQSIFTREGKPFTLNSYSPYGSKQIGVRNLGPAFGAQQAREQQQQAPAGPPGAAPGFQAPAPQPGGPPAGFGTPAPLGGFQPPQQAPGAPGAAPPAGWGPQPSFPAGAPQPGFQPQPAPQPGFQPQPAPQPGFQPQPAPQPGFQPQPAPQPGYAPAPQYQGPPQYQQPAPQQAPQYQQPPQQQPQYQQPPQQQPPQQQPPQYQQPGQPPQFGGPWGGGQR